MHGSWGRGTGFSLCDFVTSIFFRVSAHTVYYAALGDYLLPKHFESCLMYSKMYL